MIQETAGSVPCFAAVKKSLIGVTLPTWLSSRTVSNQGNGFQIPGVFAVSLCDPHVMPLLRQSGSEPLKT